jgi:cyanate permease
MLVRYENTIDDMVAFQTFNLAHSPVMKRTLAVLRSCGALLIIAIPSVFFLLLQGMQTLWISASVAFVGAAIYAAILPALFRRRFKQRLLKMYSEGSHKSDTGLPQG